MLCHEPCDHSVAIPFLSNGRKIMNACPKEGINVFGYRGLYVEQRHRYRCRRVRAMPTSSGMGNHDKSELEVRVLVWDSTVAILVAKRAIIVALQSGGYFLRLFYFDVRRHEAFDHSKETASGDAMAGILTRHLTCGGPQRLMRLARTSSDPAIEMKE